MQGRRDKDIGAPAGVGGALGRFGRWGAGLAVLCLAAGLAVLGALRWAGGPEPAGLVVAGGAGGGEPVQASDVRNAPDAPAGSEGTASLLASPSADGGPAAAAERTVAAASDDGSGGVAGRGLDGDGGLDGGGNGGSLTVEEEPEPVPRAEDGVPFTYWDGDDQRTVWLEVAPSGAGQSEARAGDSKIPDVDAVADDGRKLVFRSESGEEMGLPGGVILLLEANWSAAEVAAFLAANGIAADRVSELGWIDNGFVIATEPGLASLTLANSLAGQPGVVLSSPNWETEEAKQ